MIETVVKWILFVSLVVISNCDQQVVPNKPIWNSTQTDLLKRDLLMNYDKFARPADHLNTTKVGLALTVRHIEVNELRSIMTVYGWLKMKWNDDKLKWDSSKYGGLSMIHIAEHEVWQPDVVLYNTAGANMDHYGNTLLLLYQNGEVLWVPPCQFSVFCEMDLKYWPYDTQKCNFVLGSWTYNALQLELGLDKTTDTDWTVELDLQIENSEWKISNVSAERHEKVYPCCKEHYTDVTYYFEITRRSPSYKSIVITPASVCILLILASFWLPALSGEKIILNGVVAIIISLFLLYFSQQLPVMAFHTPLVVQFYSSALYMVCFSVIISVIVLSLSRTKQAFAVPWVFKGALNGILGDILFLSHLRVQPVVQPRSEELREQPPFEDNDDRQMIQSVTKTAIQQDWIILATAIDRIVFVVYCLIFIIFAIMYSV